MARRHVSPESTHLNRWVVSYADLMTLLFALFVVLYAASTVNQEKFKQMSQVFIGVFEKPSAVQLPQDLQTLMSDFSQSFESKETQENVKSEPSSELMKRIKIMLKDDFANHSIRLKTGEGNIQLSLPSDLIFSGSNTSISIDGEYFLSRFAKEINQNEMFLLIEVLTDNQVSKEKPWQLGAEQAMAIQQLLMLDSVSPLHMASVNYGPFQPIATNDDEDGQAMNRRINFVIYRNLDQFNRLKIMTN
ncbi:flagellar motor protein MotD [Oceaniserpentilla sp. 4NH20-0058]|uniref:flagellar motor protein MotB n=1 Tax=Oceaniserpentilla sp. 4NH20-0058 TaxID=3127660 RepID=UPI003105C948